MRRAGVVLVLVLAVLAAACSSSDKYAPLPAPKASKAVVDTTSTVPADLEQIGLPGVGGTTSTTAVAIGPGPVNIVGRVDGPDGTVAGAIVELDRVVGTRFASVRVPTAADGTWNVQQVLGGRYRVRAWLSPTLTMARAQVVFIDATNPAPVILRVDSYTGTAIEAAIGPDPAVVGSPANLAVRVSTRSVDSEGYARSTPAFGVAVTLTGSGSWSAQSSNPAITGNDGTARFSVECEQPGPQPLSAVLSDGTAQPLPLSPCVSPTPTTTSTSSSTTSTTIFSGRTTTTTTTRTPPGR